MNWKTLDSVQIPKIVYDRAFEESVAAAALGKWNGSAPQMVFGDKGGPATFLPLPMPVAAK